MQVITAYTNECTGALDLEVPREIESALDLNEGQKFSVVIGPNGSIVFTPVEG